MQPTQKQPVTATVEDAGRDVVVKLEGRLEEIAPGALGRLVQEIPPPDGRRVIIDLDGVPRLGGIGVAALTTLVGGLQESGHEVRLKTSSPPVRRVLGAFAREVAQPEEPDAQATYLIERLGERTILVREAAVRYVALLASALRHAALQTFRRGRSRTDLVFQAVVRMGVGATPLVALIAFLIGLILALQAGDLLRTYGQALRIADLVGLSITKEIAPLLTAILVAGRSGSSLTAEIGTMKVSEEVDALEVMGVDAVDYLVAPRLRALCVVLPFLTVIADVVGIAGGLVVAAAAFDITPSAYLAQTFKQVAVGEVLGGLLKAFFFSLVIVSVAAHQGFSTAGGAAGVGKYTTRSVVQAIIWIIVVDAVFTSILTAP